MLIFVVVLFSWPGATFVEKVWPSQTIGLWLSVVLFRWMVIFCCRWLLPLLVYFVWIRFVVLFIISPAGWEEAFYFCFLVPHLLFVIFFEFIILWFILFCFFVVLWNYLVKGWGAPSFLFHGLVISQWVLVCITSVIYD